MKDLAVGLYLKVLLKWVFRKNGIDFDNLKG